MAATTVALPRESLPVIRNNIPILYQSATMKRGLSKSKLIRSTRQPKSLKRILCPSTFSSVETFVNVTKCGTPRCGTCAYIIEDSKFEFSYGKVFTVKNNMNCRSKDVIYVIRCAGCGGNYIGETGIELKNRVTVHRQQIRNPAVRCIRVSGHIDECGKGNFTIFPFYKLFNDDKHLRMEKEEMFIRQMRPELNSKV